ARWPPPPQDPQRRPSPPGQQPTLHRACRHPCARGRCPCGDRNAATPFCRVLAALGAVPLQATRRLKRKDWPLREDEHPEAEVGLCVEASPGSMCPIDVEER